MKPVAQTQPVARAYRGRLFRKYFLLILAPVCGALIISGGIGLYFSYQENKEALADLQSEKAAGAAGRIEQFVLRAANVPGNSDGGAVCATQGFGGYNGAIALRAAHADAFSRYAVDRNALSAYLERWPEVRRERERRELYWRSRRRSALDLAQQHCWKGSD